MLGVALAGEEAAQAAVTLAEHQVEAGLAVPSDRMSAEVRLAEVRAMRIRAEQMVRVARAALRQALGLQDDREFRLTPPVVTAEIPAGDAEEAQIAEALTARPDLRALEVRREQAELGERIAKSHRLPEVGVGGQYEWNGRTLFGTDGSNWTVAAMVRLPLFDGFETRAKLARARADLDRIGAYRTALEEGVRLQVRAAWADREAAAERLQVAETALAQAEEALRIVRERYQEGMAVMVELLGAEAARTAAQGSRAAAARDLALAREALDLATGRGVAGRR
jgi:outer membrane protein